MSSLPAGILPLDTDQTNSLQSAVSGLSPQQLQWVSGYAAGLAAAGGQSALVAGPAITASNEHSGGNHQFGNKEKLTVLFGSQTGKGEDVAAALVDLAASAGFAAQAISLADYKPTNLKRESLVTFVVSTHGEGDPPDDAELFHEYLLSKKAPALDKLNFSVLALGDSSYVIFVRRAGNLTRVWQNSARNDSKRLSSVIWTTTTRQTNGPIA